MSKLEFLLVRKPVNRLTDKLKRRYLKLYARMLPHIDRMVMLCPEYKEQMERMIRRSGFPGSDAPAEKFISIFNPLLPPGQPVDRTAPKEKTVLYVGRFQREQKRVDRLLKIWRRIERHVPGWKLVLVGDGRDRGALEKLARRLKLQRVEFVGHQTDVTPYYRSASFICLTSNFEGLPMSLIEAQRYGVIPVSFDSYAAIRTITENGRAGIMVPAFGKRRYAAMLKAALRDDELQQRLRERCYDAPAKYDLNVIGQQWLDLFSNL